MSSFPEHMSKIEQGISNKLLTRILKHPDNLFVRVYDGEEWATEWTRDREVIQRETAATDATRYFIMRVSETGAATRIGSVLLIHGNEDDVISDGSWNTKVEGAEALIDALMAYEP